MIHKKKIKVPEHTKEVEHRRSCDICKKFYTDINVDIEYTDYEISYPECVKGTRYSYDICCECFEEKVMPILEEVGANPREEKIDR